MAGGPPYPTGGGFAALFSAGGYPSEFRHGSKCRYHLRPALSRILAARSSPGVFNSWWCIVACPAFFVRVALLCCSPLCSIRDELGRLHGCLLRPACLVSCRRGVDVNGAAKNPRICTIYGTVIYYCIAQFVACSVCAQSAKYHAILCRFALLRIGLCWRGSSREKVTQ